MGPKCQAIAGEYSVAYFAKLGRKALAALPTRSGTAAAVLIAATVLAVSASAATEKVLHHFTGGPGGALPTARLLLGPTGRLYGVTQEGGSQERGDCAEFGCGVAFEMDPSTKDFKVIHTFCLLENCADGAYPSGGLIADAEGNLYGAAFAGGNSPACGGIGCGVIYELTPTSAGGWKYKVLYTFPGGSRGGFPSGPLAFDPAGNLYGDAANGGVPGGKCAFSVGCGLVYELTPDATSGKWREKVLYTFTGGADGALPQGGLVFDSLGNLYGTTEAGGRKNPKYCVEAACGVVFQLTPSPDGSWQQKIIHTFLGGPDGGTSTAGLVFDAMGNLYGTSSEGGWGDVFEFTPTTPGGGWVEKTLGTPHGSTYAPPLLDSGGNVYGTTSNGGYFNAGSVFEFSVGFDGTRKTTVLHNFCWGSLSCLDGAISYAGLISDSDGNLYGVTALGGKFNSGVVFELLK